MKHHLPACRILNSFKTPALALALLGLAATMAPSATINFATPVTSSSDADMLPLGQPAYAYDWGTATTVNGVPFTSSTATSTVGGGNVSLGNFTAVNATVFVGTAAPYTGFSAAYQNLLKGAVYNSSTNTGTTGTVTLNNLNPGRPYALQVWVNDSRVGAATRLEWIYDGSGSATNVLNFNSTHANGGVGQYIIGNFVADNSGLQSFVLDNSAPGNPAGNSLVQMNALQLRDLSSVWSGTTSGTWADTDSTSQNFSGASYSTVKGLGLTNAYFGDVDAFGNPVATTSITVGAGGASGLNAVFLNQAHAYTVNCADSTGIAGANGVTLSGTNTVTFTGAHTYTGGTVLGKSAQLVIGASGSVANSASLSLGANATLTLGASGALAGASSLTLGAGSVLDASSSSLPLGASQTLSGYGTVKGNVTAANGATIIPGTPGGFGTLSFSNNVTLNGQAFRFDLGFTASDPSDKIVVGGALTLNGTSVISLNLPGIALFNGTYTLITFSSKLGTGTFALDKSYPGITLNNNPTSVTLTVAGGITLGGTSSVWVTPTGGNWTTATNWQGSIIATNKDALADFSTLTMPANETINVNSTGITIGYMAFADVGQQYVWTLSGGTNTMAVSSGSPTITVATNSQANINSVLAGSQGLTVEGAGFLVLGGANTLTNGINVLGGNLAITAVKGLSATTISSVNPVTCSNAFVEFATSGAQFFTNDLYLLGATNQIYQGSSAQDTFVGKIVGSGVLQFTTPAGVVLGQRGDMSGFTGTVLVTGNATGNNASGILLANGDNTTGISGSSNIVFDFEGGTLNYLYSGGPTATNYMGALVGNNGNVILQCKNGAGTTSGNVTVEVGALNSSTAFAGKFRDYANVNTGTQPPQLGIRKVGAGTLTLSGANINTGPTEVRGGNLTVSGSLAAPVTVYSGATFELSGSLGSQAVAVNSGGRFLVDNGGNLASAAVAVTGLMDVTANGTSFNLNSASLSGSGVVAGAVTLATTAINPGPVGGPGTLTITNGDLNVNGGTLAFDLSNDPTNGFNDQLVVNGNLNLTSPAAVSINKLTGSLGGGHYPLIKFSGSLNGSLANLTLSGAGPLDTLQQNGNEVDLVVSPFPTVVWTGGTAGNLWDVVTSTNWLLNGVRATFTNGEVALFNDSGATNPLVTVPATVQPAGVVVSSSSNYTFTGAADIGNGASLTKSGSGTLTILNANTYIGGTFLTGGTLKLGDGATQNGSVVGNIADSSALVVANPADQTFAGVISGGGALLKQGAGTLTLTATNMLTGPTIITAGTLALGDGSSADGLLGAGYVTNNSQLVIAETSAATISNNITGTGGIDNIAGGTVILQGAISGTCQLTNDSSAGNLYLQSSNTYSGGTTINNGTVIVHDATLHGLGSGNVVINNGTGALWFSSGGSNVLANNIQLPSSTQDQFLVPGLCTVRLTGLLTGGAAGQITRFVNLSSSGDNRGEILLDNPANSFTTIPEDYFGILGFTSDGAFGDPMNGISINVGNKVNTQFYSRADDGLRFEANNITLNPNRTINLVGNENINVQGYNGTIAGPITGSTLNKRGAGTLTVNGAGSLTNSTTVVGGALVLNSSWTGTTLTVNSGATLGGTGVISAAVQINSGGALAIGTPSPWTLTVTSSLLFSNGSTAYMNLNGNTALSDQVTGLGTVTFGGSLVVANLGGAPAVGQVYHLFTAATYAGNFTSLSLPALNSGAWSWDQTKGTLSVVTGVSTTPTNITVSASGGSLHLSWPSDHTGWLLLSNSVSLVATNNWFPVPGSTATNQMVLPQDPTKANVFFRLVYP